MPPTDPDDPDLTFSDFVAEQDELVITPVVRDGVSLQRVDGRVGGVTFENCTFGHGAQIFDTPDPEDLR